jgi:hypothetical protein
MEPADELNSFPYDATVSGKEHHYRITQNDENYGIEEDGIVIAMVGKKDNHWEQLSGDPISKELLDSLCDHIEAHHA